MLFHHVSHHNYLNFCYSREKVEFSQIFAVFPFYFNLQLPNGFAIPRALIEHPNFA